MYVIKYERTRSTRAAAEEKTSSSSSSSTSVRIIDVLPLKDQWLDLEEEERKQKWMELPRRARIVIRRLQRHFQHLPKDVLIKMLKAAKAPTEYVDAARLLRCNSCELTKTRPKTNKASTPKPYEFNNEVGIDVLEFRIQRCTRQILRYSQRC